MTCKFQSIGFFELLLAAWLGGWFATCSVPNRSEMKELLKEHARADR